ncbi:MAG TPA: transaldolase [bacterium]|jgi:transaldolase|nr:transaldolase [bacterium]
MDQTSNPLLRLEAFGQSVWLDYIRRDLIVSGGLMRLIKEDGVRGVTSNPSIFEKAIAESPAYERDIRAMAMTGQSAMSVYEGLTQQDVRFAADELRPLYDRLNGSDGYVSLEVNPHLAYDTEGTLAEARRLWAALDRPNAMIKVPATDQGLPAIRSLIAEGINVNITLIFGVKRWRQVAEAYLDGLEARVGSGKSIRRVASVASFFVSRIDAALEKKLGPQTEARGRVAIAACKVAYAEQTALFSGHRFLTLASRGARPQRLLWASTGTKDAQESDVKYVEGLIGLDTVNTVPLATLQAYRDHGNPQSRLSGGLPEARLILESLPGHGVDLEQVARALEDEGVKKFRQPFDALLASLEKAPSGLPERR